VGRDSLPKCGVQSESVLFRECVDARTGTRIGFVKSFFFFFFFFFLDQNLKGLGGCDLQAAAVL